MEGNLDVLLADGVIDELLGRLKSGKEADVWLVRHGQEVHAAKVYKARNDRTFKNNAGYKEGRAVRNTRTQRAMDRGSRFGQQAAEDAWKSAEADALYKLHAQGVRVPVPILFYEGVLIMRLVVTADGQPAPRLIDAQLTGAEAAAAYADLRTQAIKMLCCDLIHGDLSPYNVLLSGEGPVIIDFPQVVAAAHNSQAEFFFRRDIENLRVHLAGLAPELATQVGDAQEIWRAYVRRELTPEFVPSGRPPPPERPQPVRPQRQEERPRQPGQRQAQHQKQQRPAQLGHDKQQRPGQLGRPQHNGQGARSAQEKPAKPQEPGRQALQSDHHARGQRPFPAGQPAQQRPRHAQGGARPQQQGLPRPQQRGHQPQQGQAKPQQQQQQGHQPQQDRARPQQRQGNQRPEQGQARPRQPSGQPPLQHQGPRQHHPGTAQPQRRPPPRPAQPEIVRVVRPALSAQRPGEAPAREDDPQRKR